MTTERFRTAGVGSVGVHIACADLLANGYQAFMAPDAHSYDLVVDVAGKFSRVQVKTTVSPRAASHRPTRPPAYYFNTNRGHRPEAVGRKSILKPYTKADADIIACVAADIKTVAYLPVAHKFVQGIVLFPEGTKAWKRNGREQRRLITDFPATALFKTAHQEAA